MTEQVSDNKIEKTSKNGWLLSSFTIWLFVMLVGLNVFFQQVKPLQYIKTSRYVPLEQNPLVSKFPKFFDSTIHPEIIVLGSSLPMEAIARYDAEFSHNLDSTNLDAIRKYTGARYLEHLVEQKTGTKTSVFNLTCVACMTSDAEVILRRIIETGRTPKVVILGMGPRDFIDNIAPAAGKTPVCQLLSSRVTLPEIFSEKRSVDDFRDLLIGQMVYIYKVRGDYKTMLTGWACDLVSHPADLFESKMKNLPAPDAALAKGPQTNNNNSNKNKRSQFADLPEWKERYSPANFKRFEAEKASFEKMLSNCHDKGIKVIVVNMPVTEQNRALIPGNLYDRYCQEVCTLPSEYGFEMIDLNSSPSFTTSDFYDSAHLNAGGGKKVQDILVSSVNSLSL